jgi:hypothetical protein
MSEEKRHVVVVCGYGCHLDTPLKPYLDKVGAFINLYNPELVIFCGGCTQKKSAPGVSEAGLMSGYLDHDQMVLPGKKTEFVVEANSYTTYRNIRNAAWRIESWFMRHDVLSDEKVRITIFCEATRAPLVIMLARHFMGDFVDSIDDITVETASWERADPFKQVRNLIYNKLAIKYPWLGLAERECKKRICRAEQI